MRYARVSDVTFTNINGEKKILHGVRGSEVYPDFILHSKEQERELDDLAVKVWGQGMEIMAYRLREQNIDKMLCVDFNDKLIITTQIPPRLIDV